MIRDSCMSGVSRLRDFSEDREYKSLRNQFSSEVGHDNFPSALLLFSEVRDKLAARDEPLSVTEDEAYAAMLETAADLGIVAPIRRRETALLTYRQSLLVMDFHWDKVLIRATQDRDVAFLAEDLRKVMFLRLRTETSRVLITEAEKFAPSLVETVREHPHTHFVLTTSYLLYFRLLKKIFQKAENVETVLADVADRNFVSGGFDLILASPDLEIPGQGVGRGRWKRKGRRTGAGRSAMAGADPGENRNILLFKDPDLGTAEYAYQGQGRSPFVDPAESEIDRDVLGGIGGSLFTSDDPALESGTDTDTDVCSGSDWAPDADTDVCTISDSDSDFDSRSCSHLRSHPHGGNGTGADSSAFAGTGAGSDTGSDEGAGSGAGYGAGSDADPAPVSVSGSDSGSDPDGSGSLESDLVALANLLPLLSGGGRLVITLSAVFSRGSGEAARLRDLIRQDFCVMEFAEIPSEVINGNRADICLLDIENSRPEDHVTKVRRYSRFGYRTCSFSDVKDGKADFAGVNLADLGPQEPWLIRDLLSVDEPVFSKYMNTGVPKVKLSSAARVFPGRSFTYSRSKRGLNIVVVGAGNAVDREVSRACRKRVKGDLRKLADELLQEGDVIIASRVTRIQARVFCAQPFPCIAAEDMFVIRPDPSKLLGNYLMIFFTSPTWEELVKTPEFACYLDKLSCEDLQDLSIPMPPLEEQRAVVAEYFAEKKIYHEAQKRVQERWQSVLKRLQVY